jgi:rsbT co-antagonist protein RsbR
MAEATESYEQLHYEVQLLRDMLASQEVELAETQRALRQAERRLRLFVEHAPAAVAILDRERRFLLATRRWNDDFRLGPQPVAGRLFHDVFPDAQESVHALHQRALAGETLAADDDPFPRPDGPPEWFSWKLMPWYDDEGAIGGICILAQNVTERHQADEALRAQMAEQQRLLDTIRTISTPVIPVHDEILVLPLVGTIDSRRSAQIMEALLTAVQQHSAEVVIIDITGVPLVDTSVANHLIQATQAATLLGAHCVLVGISAEVAQTMVQLGVNLSNLKTCGNLQDGIAYALERQGRAVMELAPHTRRALFAGVG